MVFRKIISIFIFFNFLCLSVFSQVNLTQGLVAYYPFTGNANDASGNNNNPIFNNATPTNDRNGNANSAYHFNGIDNYMQIPNALSLNSSNTISVCAWVKVTGFYYGNCHSNRILMKGNTDFTAGNYTLAFDDAVYTAGTSCSNPYPDTLHQNFRAVCGSGSPNFIQKNVWHSVIYVSDGSSCKLYVDCQLQDNFPTAGLAFTNPDDLFFGKMNNPSFPYWFNGDLDEVRIYNRAINFDEVLALNNISKSEFTFSQNICNPKQITFKNESTNYTKYYWHFGNGNIDSTSVQPTITYNGFGNYFIKLITANNFGCADTSTKNVAVNIFNDSALIVNKSDTAICSGSSVKLNVKDSGLSYCWYTSNSNIINNSANFSVSPTATTTYNYTTQIAGANLIVNGDFESGNVGFTTSYTYKTPPANSQAQYYIGNSSQNWFSAFYPCKDHTSSTGNMFIADGSPVENAIVWKQSVNISPNTNYVFSAWLQSIYPTNPAQLKFSINGTQVGQLLQASTTTCNWKQFYVVWNSGNNSIADISIVNQNTIVQGNDFAIDDISFAPIETKTDSIKINVTNCIPSYACQGVLELHGQDKVSLKSPFKKYYSSTGFTWETWFNSSYYANNNNSIDTRNKLISAIDIIPAEDILIGFGWVVGAPKNAICFVVDGVGGIANRDNTPCFYKPPTGFVPNTWYHVAGVRDYTNNQTKLYLNGQLVDTKSNNHAPIPREMTTFLGNFLPILDSGFAGKMDEIRIWNTVRTASEIQANYNQCLTGNEVGLVAYFKSNEKNGSTLKDATPNANNATLGSTVNFNKNDNAPLVSICQNASFSLKDTTICQGDKFWNYGASGIYRDTFVNSMGCDSVRTLNLLVNNCNVARASFTAPDTVCINSPVNFVNTSSGATTYNWSFCNANVNGVPVANNMGNLGGVLSRPVFIDYIQEGANFYGFLVNHDGSLVRLDFGNSLLNTPATVLLGNVGGIMNLGAGNEGIQVVKQNGKFFVFIVGGNPVNGTSPKLMRFEFGTNITNANPIATDFGNLGNMLEPIDLYMFQDNGHYYGFTANAENNTLTRFDFTTDLSNTPTAINMGNIGGMLNYPTGINAVNDNGFWRVFLANGGNSTLLRLDFGASLLNVPTVVSLGNPANTIDHPRDLIMEAYCDGIVGFCVNGTSNTLTRLNFNSYTDVPTAINLGNTGNFNFPHSLTKLFRSGADVYSFVTNVSNNTVTRIKFSGCVNASIPNSTASTPPAVVYNAIGIYNVNLTVDDGLATQSVFCKKIVVVAPPTLTITKNKTVCYDSAVQLNASGAINYSWTPKLWLNDSAINNPISLPKANIKYYVTGSLGAGCSSRDSVVLTVLPQVAYKKDTIKGCGIVVFGGNTYNTNTLLTTKISNYLGCDSIIFQHQILLSNKKDTITKQICLGQSYWNHSTSGFYDSTFKVANNCDSIVTLRLLVDRYIKDTINPIVCFGDKFLQYQTSGIYYDTITSSTSCDTIRTIQLTVRKKLSPTLFNDMSICEGDTLQLYPGFFKKYLWNNGKQTPTISINNIGTYWVQVTDTFGCKAIDTFKLVSLYPLPQNFLPNPFTACFGEVSPNLNYVSYLWNTGETTASINLNGLNNYWVKVSDVNSCFGSDTMKVIYLGDSKFNFVNAFSPNNDGKNDVFKPTDAVCITAFTMQIYNRWGQLVFQSSNPTTGWNGYYKGNVAPIGVYYYIINYKNISGLEKRQTGSVTLIR